MLYGNIVYNREIYKNGVTHKLPKRAVRTMTLTREQEFRELEFIEKEKQRVHNTNPEKERRKAFFQELKETHPDLAEAFTHQPLRR